VVVAGVVVGVGAAVVVFRGLDLSRVFTESPLTPVTPVTTGLEPEPMADDTARPVPPEEQQAVAAPPPAPTRQAPTPPPQRDTTPSFEAAALIKSPPDTTPQVAADDSVPTVAQALPLDTTPAIESPADTAAPVAVVDSAPAAAPPAGGTLRRYARTWVSIREARSDSAPAVRTLEPGEVVQVDSLSQGWYRVVVSGRTVGYVDGGYLDVEAP
jgi:hypothetical protein